MTLEQLAEQESQYVAHTYGRFPVAFESGKGCILTDTTGRRYIDLGAGIAVSALGYGDTKWARAVAKQAAKLAHTSNYYYTEPMISLAQKLCEATGYRKVFFANSGAEANEGAIKAARKYSFDKYHRRDRGGIITLKNSFHGRTVATLTATGQEVFHQSFFPFAEGFAYAPAGDIEALRALVDESTCAVMMEPVQGEGGVYPLDHDYVRAVFELAAERDLLVIFDEVQTGVGRTGTFLASEQYGVKPDITTLAKALGGGLPIGAVLFSEKTEAVLGKGDHGSTFGGNPVACAGANVVLDRVAKKSFLNRVKKKGERMMAAIRAFESPHVKDVRGMGLMIGVELDGMDAKDTALKLLGKGLLALTAGGNTLRLLPPLVIDDKTIDESLGILKEVLSLWGD
ncbi:aspartate aminotransferase family protein [Feifania hominis]|uniref:Acetylornithine aminotransferase n=1 Tax=Feifania hominis TaxID=2763660 RepID=A0A926HUG3_9FIRM|nr:aspartate aminotransferase family protein [Feifania hominis]MBC8536884.1 aspartate aminotransferase family protein [Feifania hominis]